MSTNTQIWTSDAIRVDGPLIRISALLGPLEALMSEQARSAAKLKQQLQVLRGLKNPESLIDGDDYLDAFARMEHMAVEPELILRTALAQDLGQLGLFGKAIVHAETFWESLIAAQEGFKYFQSQAEFVIRIRNNRCRVSYHHAFGDHPEAAVDIQYTIGLLCNLVREAKHAAKADLHVCYPGARAEHSSLIPQAIRMHSGQSGFIEFNDNLLRSPLRQTDAYLSMVSKMSISEFKVDTVDVPTASQLVTRMQAASIEDSHSPVSLACAAALLDLPERSLQAQLKAEKTSFAGLRQRVQHQVARRELLAGRSIEHTSEMLGFAQRQNFSEAFSKWEGLSPSEFASRGRGGSE